MKNLLDFISNKPLPELQTNEQSGFCPYCSSTNIIEECGETTLLGYFGYWNVNHRFFSCSCNDCNKLFRREVKANNEWYTDDKRNIILGLPTCFEKYYYKCNCGGKIQVKDLELNSDEECKILVITGDGKRKYREVVICDSCGLKEEVYYGYWRGYNTKHESDQPLSLKNFSENVGIAVYNHRGLSKLKIGT